MGNCICIYINMYRQIGGYFWAELSYLSRTFIFKGRSVFVNRRMDWKGTPFFTVPIVVCFLKEREKSAKESNFHQIL